MFAIPIIGLRSVRTQLPLWLKLCSVSGLLMTLLSLSLAIVPIIRVESRLVFALKISGLIVATNVIGIALFLLAEKKRSASRRQQSKFAEEAS